MAGRLALPSSQSCRVIPLSRHQACRKNPYGEPSLLYHKHSQYAASIVAVATLSSPELSRLTLPYNSHTCQAHPPKSCHIPAPFGRKMQVQSSEEPIHRPSPSPESGLSGLLQKRNGEQHVPADSTRPTSSCLAKGGKLH